MTSRFALPALALMLSGCAIQDALPGPAPPPAEQVTEVRVTSIAPATAPARTIRDPDRISAIARSHNIASEGWWQAKGRDLWPLHRIDLVDRDGRVTTYWLGINSYPARFPCYKLCSGWWLAPSTPDGNIDTSKYRGLTSTQYFNFLDDLGFAAPAAQE